MAESDSGEKTEKASDKRMKEVHEKGRLSRSQDLSAWIAIGAAGLLFAGTVDAGTRAGRDQLRTVADVIVAPDPAKAVQALGDGLGSVTSTVTPLLVVVLVVALATALAQGGLHFRKIRPHFEHWAPAGAFSRMFGMQALWEGTKSLLKTAVVGGVLALAIAQILPVLASSAALPLTALLDVARGGIGALVASAVAAGLAIAAADLLVVMRRNRKHTRMSRKELQDEHKSSEGDPLIRSQRRSRQLAMSRNRMIAAVSDADVVIVNPTHVAVALKYEPGRSAPRVVAKGQDLVAARIRERAEEAGVPTVRDIPLARALHAACEIDQEIPVELYNAVAKLLAFVMALKRRGAARGAHQMPQPSTIPAGVPTGAGVPR